MEAVVEFYGDVAVDGVAETGADAEEVDIGVFAGQEIDVAGPAVVDEAEELELIVGDVGSELGGEPGADAVGGGADFVADEPAFVAVGFALLVTAHGVGSA